MGRFPPWAIVVSSILVALGLLFFVQTRDPMLLIMPIFWAGLLLFGVAALKALRGGLGGVRVKCRECGALNLEDAKFCSACGKSM